MHTHNGHDAGENEPREIDTSLGYEKSDVGIRGILVFLVAIGIFTVVIGVFAFGFGKVLNAKLRNDDGPANKWSKTVDVRSLGNLPSSPALQDKMAELTQNYPTPRVQTDDGNQDVANLHAREDILLENYTAVEGSQGKVRIPIERAMELIAQRGLPVAPEVESAPLLTGDSKTEAVTIPLTSGFARTGYEQDQAESQTAHGGEGK